MTDLLPHPLASEGNDDRRGLDAADPDSMGAILVAPNVYNNRLPPLEQVAPLLLVRWSDPMVERRGFPVTDPYTERYWLGVIGPSALWLLRRLDECVSEHSTNASIDFATTAQSLGLGSRSGRHSPFLRAVRRLCTFGLISYQDSHTVAVRSHVPPITARQLQRLPESLQLTHEADLSTRPETVAELRQRAERLALSLVDLGQSIEETEQQLHRWKFHPALAYHAATWAWGQHHRDRPPLLVQLPPDDAA